MDAPFKCQCGVTEREHPRPADCETCPVCGSKIIGQGENYDDPLPHAPVPREDQGGHTYIECKRCRKILNG